MEQVKYGSGKQLTAHMSYKNRSKVLKTIQQKDRKS
jgi:hypothetical protein